MPALCSQRAACKFRYTGSGGGSDARTPADGAGAAGAKCGRSAVSAAVSTAAGFSNARSATSGMARMAANVGADGTTSAISRTCDVAAFAGLDASGGTAAAGGVHDSVATSHFAMEACIHHAGVLCGLRGCCLGVVGSRERVGGSFEAGGSEAAAVDGSSPGAGRNEVATCHAQVSTAGYGGDRRRCEDAGDGIVRR